MKGLLLPALAFGALTAAGQPALKQLPAVEQLAAPIALYPDPLLALVLPASSEPWHIREAYETLAAGKDPDSLTDDAWCHAVIDLAHFPAVTRWMSENQLWTGQLGTAFAARPETVMRAIQDLRARALARGVLASGPEIRIRRIYGAIEILPAQRDVLYVPRYDPDTVFTAGVPGPYLTWSPPRRIGPWLGYYCNWRLDTVWAGDWLQHNLAESPAPKVPAVVALAIRGQAPQGHEWRPAFNAPIRNYHFAWNDAAHVLRPALMQGTPAGFAYSRNRNGRFRESSTQPATFPGDTARALPAPAP